MYCSYGFSRDLVAEREEMGEVILTEGRIVALQASYALLFLCGVLPLEAFDVCETLYLPAVLSPLLLHFLEI